MSVVIALLMSCAPEPMQRTRGQRPAASAARIDTAAETLLLASDGDSSDAFGNAIANAGDIDDDGYADFIVGAFGDDDVASAAGAAYVYYGVPTGVDASTEDKITASDGASGQLFGDAVSGAGDIDGDGHDDVIVGARNDDDNGYYSGSAYVYYGTATGIDADSEDKITASDGYTSDYFGRALAGVGDVDGDGYADVAISAHLDDDSGSGSGSVYLYYGTATGIDIDSEHKIIASDGVAGDYFGRSVAHAGDANDDGYSDIIIGAYAAGSSAGTGVAYVYYGSAAGIDSSSEHKITASDGSLFDSFGYAVAGGGDINGDGYSDVIVGAYDDDDSGSGSGSVYLYYGTATGIDSSSEHKLIASDGAAYDALGKAVADGGDINGDGYSDIIVGAYADDDSGASSGSAYVYYGSATGIDSSSEHKLTASDGNTDDFFGAAIAAADIDGDGYADLLVGAPNNDDSAGNAGSVYLFHGTDADGDGVLEFLDCDDSDASVGEASTHYADTDEDGYGDTDEPAEVCPDTSGYAQVSGDCDDNDDDINPGAAEICDEEDNDCDGSVDEGVTATFYADDDNDGYGDATDSVVGCSAPAGYAQVSGDCDDTTAAISPAAAEVCDGIDNDCDGSVDEADAVDALTWYLDGDGDGHGSSYTTVACQMPSGYVAVSDDCDDADASVGAASTHYADTDGDGYGDPSSSAAVCPSTAGYTTNSDDCDDGEAFTFPGAAEACDGRDNDCDGSIDEGVTTTYYEDDDGDGYGDSLDPIDACSAPSGYALTADDCDDSDASISPAAAEVCDGDDNDCDGEIDEDDATDALTFYADADADGYGDPDETMSACGVPSGYIANGDDCDDTDASISPSGEELCDGVDNDCDGHVDEDDAADAATWYADEDGDGYGSSVELSTETSCYELEGYADNDEDCDDADDEISPEADEVCGDGTDSDCDGEGGPEGDDDDDGLSWAEEEERGTDDCEEDTDGDGLTDGAEDILGTDPLDMDTDGDGLPDGVDDAPKTPEEDDTGCPAPGKPVCASAAGAPGSGLAALAVLLAARRRRGLTARPPRR